MKHKYLIIDCRPESWANMMGQYGADLYSPYANLSKPLKILREVNRKLHKYLNIPYLSCWFNKYFLDNISQYTHIIVFVQKNSQDILTFLSKRVDKNQRLIAWFWNPVYRVLQPSSIRHLNCELWSFDTDDCLKYTMKYNSTFFLYPKSQEVKKDYKYGYVYLGANKGRLGILNSLNIKLDKLLHNNLFYIVDETKPKNKRKSSILYDDYLKLLYVSQGIIDVVQDNQTGLTLRVMESIFFKKKLITTNKTVKELPFYNSNNIHILDENSTVNELAEFIDKEYIDIDPRLVDYYTFYEWLKRFSE